MIKLLVENGARLGRLTIGERVLPSDPRVQMSLTPESYIEQGSLRECKCDCGETCYISTYQLERRKVQSCGCVRLGMRKKAFTALGSKAKLARVKYELGEAMTAYRMARIQGNGDEESRLHGVIIRLREQEKAMVRDIP